jgi:hypothetical protein
MAVRRVRRIIRRIDPWTVLKVSLVLNAIAALIFVLGTWVTWSLALRRGIPDRVVDIFESLTLSVTIEGELYFRIVVLLAIIGAILATALMTLGALLYNLIADLVGGIEIAVLEETYRPAATRTKMVPAAVPTAAVQPAVTQPASAVSGEGPFAPIVEPDISDHAVEMPVVPGPGTVETPAAAGMESDTQPGDPQGSETAPEEAELSGSEDDVTRVRTA